MKESAIYQEIQQENKAESIADGEAKGLQQKKGKIGHNIKTGEKEKETKMTAAYSIDLREKAVLAVDRGEKKSYICRTLNISRNTLDQWLKRREEKGTVAPKEYRRGLKPKIDDLEAFKTFAEANVHLTQKEMAEK